MIGPKVSAATGTDGKILGALLTNIQGTVTVSNGKISTTRNDPLKYIGKSANTAEKGKNLVDYWGTGHFLALEFSNLPRTSTETVDGVTYYKDVRVGLRPSHQDKNGKFVHLDSEKDGVFKITNKDEQKLVVQWRDSDTADDGTSSWKTESGWVHEDVYDLSGLYLGYQTDDKLVSVSVPSGTNIKGTTNMHKFNILVFVSNSGIETFEFSIYATVPSL